MISKNDCAEQSVVEGNRRAGFSSNQIYMLLLIAAVFLNIKYIFVDFGIDAEYQIAMSYRLVKGDALFKEMWEPHQMSTFICALFIKIYMSIFHTTTGIVLYLQVIGVLLDGAIAYFLYRVVNKHLDSGNVAFAMAWVFFVVSPKDVPIAEFANMQIWFSMLLCITLFLYYKAKKKGLVVLSAIWLCAAVLSYPSCLILVVGAGYLLFRYGEKIDLLIFMAVCCVAGILYLCITLRGISISEFLIFFENMQAIETSHAMGLGEKFMAYLQDAAKIAIIFCIAYGISYIVAKVLSRKSSDGQNRETCRILTDIFFCILILFVSLYTVISWEDYIRYSYSLSFLAIILIGMRYAKELSADKFYFYLCGTLISFLNFIATLILTDLELIGSVPYLLIALIVAFLPIGEALKAVDGKALLRTFKRAALIGGIILLAFRNAYLIRPMYLQVKTIGHIHGIVKEGPAMGIISEYMGPYMQNESMKEWDQYIEDGSNIFLVGNPLDVLGYLYEDTNVAAPSVVCTPGYNESILEYWEMNPHKYPDVIVVSYWYGTLYGDLTEDSWIIKWLEEEYKPEYYVEGKYWRYYFK